MAGTQGDMRVPKGECLRWSLSADTEALAWQPAQDTAFVVSTEDGTVAAFDARGGSGTPSVLFHACLSFRSAGTIACIAFGMFPLYVRHSSWGLRRLQVSVPPYSARWLSLYEVLSVLLQTEADCCRIS